PLSRLGEHGRTELVQVVVQLKVLPADEIRPELEKMLSPFGKVFSLNRPNQLVIQDTVGNVERIVTTLNDIESREGEGADQFPHHCQYVKARDAERVLREMLGDPAESRGEGSTRGRGGRDDGQRGGPPTMMFQLPGGFPQPGMAPGGFDGLGG